MRVSLRNFISSPGSVLPSPRRVIAAMVLAIAASPVVYAEQQDDAWFDTDWEQQTNTVNEGELELFEQPPETDLHVHYNRISIDSSSIDDGRVHMEQCHRNLDAVSALQIVFNRNNVDQLRIVSYRNIEKARVEKNTVQLENIKPDSRICLSARTRALHRKGDRLVLENGPFMRRFLDGYYPMQVNMHVIYPMNMLRFVRSGPVALKKQTKRGDAGELEMEVIFSGRLRTEFVFMVR